MAASIVKVSRRICRPLVPPPKRQHRGRILEGSTEPPAYKGILQSIVAKVPTKLLDGARVARYDLLATIQQLATQVPKWGNSK